VFCGLLAARRIAQHPALLTLIGCVLVLWMFPRYKFFEHSLAMMAVYLAARLLENPGLGRHFVAGLFVGLAAFFGRNHGLYCGLGFLLVILLLHWKRRSELPLLKNLAVWSGGILLGVSPLLAMLFFVPGFAASFFRSLVDFVPLSLSILWPWQLPEGAHGTLWLGTIGIFVCYIALAVAYPLGLLAAWFTKPEPLASRSVLIASVCVGVFYSHHVWGRADHNHLVQGIHPLLLGLLAAPVALGWGTKGVRARAIWIGVVSITVVVALVGFQRPLGAFGLGPLGGVPYEQYDLRGDTLRIPVTTARRFAAVEAVVRERVRDDEPSDDLLPTPGQGYAGVDPLLPAPRRRGDRRGVDPKAGGGAGRLGAIHRRASRATGSDACGAAARIRRLPGARIRASICARTSERTRLAPPTASDGVSWKSPEHRARA